MEFQGWMESLRDARLLNDEKRWGIFLVNIINFNKQKFPKCNPTKLAFYEI